MGNLTLKQQLITALLVVGLLPFTIMGVISYVSAERALSDQALSQLDAVSELQRNALKSYLEAIESSIEQFGQSQDVTNMYRELVRLHSEYNVGADEAFDITNEADVQAVYREYEKTYRQIMDAYDLYDIFMICRPHGHVMYSVEAESDLGENLGSGKLRDSGLAEAWRRTVATGDTTFVDMSPYEPSGGEPAMFMGVPIMDSGNMVGVMAVQISPKTIDEILHNRAGLGETGESFVVGEDFLMRSDSQMSPEKYSIANSFANPQQNSARLPAVEAALRGESETRPGVDLRGTEALLSAGPIDVFGDATWALVTTIELSEVNAPVVALRNIALILGVIVLVVVTALAIFLALRLSRPIISAVESISDANAQVLTASDQIASSATSLAEGASTQASSVEEVSATIEQSTAVNNQNAENAREANILANQTNEAAQLGDTKIKSLTESMNEITDASQQIAKIIKTIDEIAFQTNLLALNAAVEAARAGEHGLGFAVVADEVKNLAQRSANAAKETADIIETAIEKIKEGNQVANETNEAFGDILDRAKKTGDLIGEIAASVKEQADGMNQIATAMGQIDTITQQNAATSEEAAAASEEMNAQAASMMESVTDVAKIVGLDLEKHGVDTSRRSAPQKKHAASLPSHKQPAQKKPASRPAALPSGQNSQKKPASRHSDDQQSRSNGNKSQKEDDIFPLDEDDLKEF
jgi:methyl-accepting chemotaxis protein